MKQIIQWSAGGLFLLMILGLHCWNYPENPEDIMNVEHPITLPDLNIKTFSLFRGDQEKNFYLGESLQVWVEVENSGNTQSPSCTLTGYLSMLEEEEEINRIPLFKEDFPALLADEQQVESYYSDPVFIEDIHLFNEEDKEYRRYLVTVFVDNEGLIQEFSNINNKRSILVWFYNSKRPAP